MFVIFAIYFSQVLKNKLQAPWQFISICFNMYFFKKNIDLHIHIMTFHLKLTIP